MENLQAIQKSGGVGFYEKAKQLLKNNPLFADESRNMSCGDYINIHQRQLSMGTSRFNWLTPDED